MSQSIPCLPSSRVLLDLPSRCSQDKEHNFYSSDSDFDDEEPKKFHIQIRPVASGRGGSAATEKELKATMRALTLPPNRGGRQQVAGTRVLQEVDQRRATPPPTGMESRRVSAGPPPVLITADAFSSDSSSPDNVEDSGLDSPSHQPLGPSPEPAGWAAWPPPPAAPMQTLGRPADPFLSAFRDPSPARSPPRPRGGDPAGVWSVASSRPSRGGGGGGPPSVADPPPPPPPAASVRFPAFSPQPLLLPTPEAESSAWSCRHAAPEDPFLAAFERTGAPEASDLSSAWARPPPRPRPDPFAVAQAALPTCSSSSSSSSSRRKDRKREQSLPPPAAPDDPFAITMIGSPTHQSTLAAAAGLGTPPLGGGGEGGGASTHSLLEATCSSLPSARPEKELIHWNSFHNPFSEGGAKGEGGARGEGGAKGGGGRGEADGGRRKHRSSDGGEPRRNAPPLTRHSGPQVDLCFSTDKDQDCLDLNAPPAPSGSHAGSKHTSVRRDSADVSSAPRTTRVKRTSGRQGGCERSRSLCSSPQPEPPRPALSASSSSSSSSSSCASSGSPAEWGPQGGASWGGPDRAPSPASPPPPHNQDQQQRQRVMSYLRDAVQVRGPPPWCPPLVPSSLLIMWTTVPRPSSTVAFTVAPTYSSDTGFLSERAAATEQDRTRTRSSRAGRRVHLGDIMAAVSPGYIQTARNKTKSCLRSSSRVLRDTCRALPVLRDTCRALRVLRDTCRALPVLRDTCRALPVLRDTCRALRVLRDTCRALPVLKSLPSLKGLYDNRELVLDQRHPPEGLYDNKELVLDQRHPPEGLYDKKLRPHTSPPPPSSAVIGRKQSDCQPSLGSAESSPPSRGPRAVAPSSPPAPEPWPPSRGPLFPPSPRAVAPEPWPPSRGPRAVAPERFPQEPKGSSTLQEVTRRSEVTPTRSSEAHHRLGDMGKVKK
ncbi:F-BAR domain only protein 1 [Liparis tanakae]|uniref:F-BAR domain only protein 1 n=1 Tax=Liparis tanakae TaxID=230148 RepID=A0A4Z2FAM8_9TELE|nr:F-BAR domain only protein 1 [Liparis tanakae]